MLEGLATPPAGLVMLIVRRRRRGAAISFMAVVKT